MSEFNKSDLFSDDLLAAPMTLSKGMDGLAKSIDNVRQIAMSMEKSLQGATSLQKIKNDTNTLTAAEQELDKVSKQLAASEAKKNQTYIDQVKAIQANNKEVKEKISLGDRDAKTVNAQNASYKVLEAALTKNKNAYKELTNEEQRNSAAGKELLKIIQAQDAQVKELGKSMGESQKNVGNYSDAVSGLDLVSGGAASQLKNLGSQLKALIANPYILAIAGLVATFQALKSAVTSYYTATLEGEEAQARRGAITDAFFTTLKRGWAEVGESIDKTFSAETEKKVITWSGRIAAWINPVGPILGPLFEKLFDTKRFNKLADEGLKFAEQQSNLLKEHLRDVVDDAETELKVNELLDDSKNKLLFTDKERLNALDEANKLLRDQVKGDLDLAKKDQEAAEQAIRKDGGRINSKKLLSQYTDQELKDLGTNFEMIKKLGNAQEQYLKIQSDAAAKEKTFTRQRSALVAEIEKQERDALNRLIDARLSKKKQELDIEATKNDEISKNLNISLEERVAAIKKSEDLKIEALEIDKKNELNIVKRTTEDRIRAEGGPFSAAIVESDKALINQRLEINAKYEEMRRLQTQQSNDEILKIQIDASKKLAHAQYIEAKEGLDATVQLIKQNAIDGKITKQEADQQILKAQKDLSDDYVKIQIDELRKILMIEGLGRDEKIKIEEQLYKLKVDLQNAYFEQLKGKYDDEIEFLNKLQHHYQMFASGVSGLFHDISDAKIAELDREEQHNNDKLNRELQAAGDNARAKADIQAAFDKKNAEIEKKKIEQQRKAALFDKAISATQAAIGVSLAVIKAGVVTPLAILTGIAGAIQIAAILAKPIPSYFKGTLGKPHKGGPALVGEKGFELMKEPGKPFSLTPNNASIMDLAPGTEILDHEKTIKMLAMEGLRTTDTRPRANENNFREIGKKLDLLNHTIKHKKELHINYSRQGAEAVIKSAEARLKFMRDFYD